MVWVAECSASYHNDRLVTDRVVTRHRQRVTTHVVHKHLRMERDWNIQKKKEKDRQTDKETNSQMDNPGSMVLQLTVNSVQELASQL